MTTHSKTTLLYSNNYIESYFEREDKKSIINSYSTYSVSAFISLVIHSCKACTLTLSKLSDT